VRKHLNIFRLVSAATVVVLAALAGGTARAADPSPTAKGRFKSKDVFFDALGAFAFRGKASLDPTKDALIVAVSNAGIRPEIFGRYFDRKRTLEKRLKDNETAIVYFEFSPQGKYRGLSYYLEPGNGCGYCASSEVESSVKLSGGKLAGSLKSDKEKDRTFDITLDVPLQSDDHGAVLPEGGGAPAKAYLAYHGALVAKDTATLKPFLSEGLLKSYASFEKKEKLDEFLGYLHEEHPVKSVRITKGFSTSSDAVLLIEGESEIGKMTGEVLLLNEKGSWRVHDEVVEMKPD
jgi:hypothetical protein